VRSPVCLMLIFGVVLGGYGGGWWRYFTAHGTMGCEIPLLNPNIMKITYNNYKN
jgi:hypothetical protein